MQAKQLGGDTSRGWRSWSQRFDAEAEQVGARSKAEAFVREILDGGNRPWLGLGRARRAGDHGHRGRGRWLYWEHWLCWGRRRAAVPALQPARALLSFSSSRRAFNEVLQTRLCRAGGRGGDPVTHILGSPRAAPSSPQPPRAALAGDSCEAPGRDRAAGTGTVRRHRRGYPISQHRLEHPQSQGSIIFR